MSARSSVTLALQGRPPGRPRIWSEWSSAPEGFLGDVSLLPIIIGYALCSSLLAVVNKAAISVFPFTTVLTALQYTTCVIAVSVLLVLRVLKADPFQWSVVFAFLPAAACFYLAIFTNTNLLKHANVDTFIVFRSAAPIMVAVADTIFRRVEWPSMFTFASLGTILLGAVAYVVTDSQFTVRAYTWAFAYLAIVTFDMVYIKHIVNSLGISTWGLVLYNNAISMLLSPAFWIVTGEFRETDAATIRESIKPWVMIPVGLSCAFGVAISFYGFACRRAVSATSFTVLGVSNKLLTIIVNVAIWDKHASPVGILCLLVTICGGVMYQQSTAHSSKPSLKASNPGTPSSGTSSPRTPTPRARFAADAPLVTEDGLPLMKAKHIVVDVKGSQAGEGQLASVVPRGERQKEECL